MRRNRWRLWPITALACLFVVLMASTPAGATPAQVVDVMALQGPVKPSEPDKVESVPGADFAPPAARPDPEAAPARRSAAKADWPETGMAEVTLSGRSAAATKTRAGSLPVWVAATGRPGPERVKVEVRDRAAAERAGVSGLLVSVRRTDGKAEPGPVTVTVGYSAFKDAYGADWASRLRLAPASGDRTPVTAVRNDLKAETVSAEVSVGDAGSTFALTAAPNGPKGDYKATSLAPSSQWQVSAQNGDFAWSYPMRTPPVPGELDPPLALSYSSGAVDGHTVATNNQPSWVGEGWNLAPGFIERSYKGCAEDLGGNNGQTKTGDLCWETENATLSFGEQSGPLVYQNGVWRPEDDDGTRVEHLFRDDPQANGDDNGEYWKVTTGDGTQYFFGLNRLPGWAAGREITQSAWTEPVYGNDTDEPCYNKTAFAASACQQAYRWNLDYVVDAHGNSMSYFYNQESNRYAQNNGASTGTYTRGGTLARIDYGTRAGQEYSSPAPARVVFDSADRCVPDQNCATHTTAVWPDVPWDTDCASIACADRYSPTFWSTKRLAKVTTQVSIGGGNYRGVDQWEFAYTYPPANDGSGDKALWLNSVTQTGLAGTAITLDAVTFDGTMMANRVNFVADGLPALNKPRITSIVSESGGAINVSYARPDCAPGALPAAAETNTKRCFPQRWTMPPATTPVNDWFQKYVVSKVVEDDAVTDTKDMVTSYDYVGGGAWAYNDNPLVPENQRTWSDWRGFEKVTVRKGDPANDENKPESKTQYLYFRGMNGDRLNPAGGAKQANVTDSAGVALADAEPLKGFLREQITYDGTKEVTGAINDPWIRLTATQGSLQANQVETARTETREPYGTGTNRVTRVETTYDEYGNPTKVNDLGDVAVPGDDRCTTTTYARNVPLMLVELPSRTTTVGVACGTDPSYPADAISDTRLSYDGQEFGMPPLRGEVTRTEEAKSYEGATPVYRVSDTSTFDSYGRVKEARDALLRLTTTSYTEVNGLTTETKVTNPLGHTVTTTLDPARGNTVQEKDANDRTTSLTYDALGRLVKVYQPGRTEAAGQTPNTRYEYGLRRSGGPNWVLTSTLGPNGNRIVTYALYDGFLRPRQTQAASPGGGRILTDTLYDSRGLVSVKRAAYHHTDAPGTTLYQPEGGNVPNALVTTYDGAERKRAEITMTLKPDGTMSERWRTSTSYSANWVSVIPPEGGTVTTTYTDARDQVYALVQWQGRTLSGPNDVTRYAYTKAGDLAKVTDPAGNVWRYAYDVLGRKVKAEDPDKGTSTMTYDDADQQLTTTDARGKTVVSVYDDLGRTAETHLTSATGTLLTKTVYDTLAKGALTSSTRYVGGQPYVNAVTGYDAAGRPEATSVTIPGVEQQLAGTYTTTLTYAADGSPATKTLPKLGDLPKETLTYGYDDLGHPDTVGGDLTYLTDTEYNELGEVAQRELGPAAKRLWRTTYYEEGTRRITEALTEREQVNGVMVNDLTYGYDPAGNVTRITDRTAGSTKDTQCFTVDYLRRITEAWTQGTDTCATTPSASAIGGPAPYWHQYGYDLTGNRKTKTVKGVGGTTGTVTAYSYPNAGDGVARPHAVTATTTGSTATAYGYDAAGNTTSRPGAGGSQTLTWDDEGLLASIAAGGKVTSYLYDAQGGQLIRRDPGSVTLFVGDGELRLNTATGSTTGTRYYDDLGTRTGDGFTWTVADQHGTSQTAVNATTLVATSRRLDLFGDPRGAATAWSAGDRGFVGGTANPETGLTRLGAREYDPAMGRFLSVDPVIDPYDPQQMNAYAYSNNNPATMSDPDGLSYSSPKDHLKKALTKHRNTAKKRMITALRKHTEQQIKLKKKVARGLRAWGRTHPNLGKYVPYKGSHGPGYEDYSGPHGPGYEDYKGDYPWRVLLDKSFWYGVLLQVDWQHMIQNGIRQGLDRLGNFFGWVWENRGKILGTLGAVASALCVFGWVCAAAKGLWALGTADSVIGCFGGNDISCLGGALSAGTFLLGETVFKGNKAGELGLAGLDLALTWFPFTDPTVRKWHGKQNFPHR
ncbi:RHS repeat-associated core domain-containing protein [Nonomuraea aurantiaca]|uniref:RHS repeat-associated core domain-containing protein n=1 Tax=Nonomuraea aurantiaca TaxID=2878562 RepID=UPI001CDA1EF7|nr:RHS repeat-associated core domain-containing protein [Nonomuraea aurantiaca]MCA2220414.1 type IV secretion protein Rhs [Nonomuraea aurantiaca]